MRDSIDIIVFGDCVSNHNFSKKNPKMKNKTSNTECSQQMSVFLFLNRTVSVYSWFADEKTEAHKFKGFDLRPERDI